MAGVISVEDICSEFFEARMAKTEEDVHLARRIRFEVYCREAGYFDPESYDDACETDAYDSHSVESVLFYRPTRVAVGSVRIIVPIEQAEGASRFPFDRLVEPTVLERLKDLPEESSAEVSRFCITRRLSDELTHTPGKLLAGVLGHQSPSVEDLREITRSAKIELMHSIVAMSRRHQITHLCAVMEPFLLRSLRHLGIHFMRVGPMIDYHGQRQPCYAPLDWLLRVMRRERKDIWNVLTERGQLAV